MRILLLAMVVLPLVAQSQPMAVVLEPQTGDQAMALDPALLRSDLQVLLRENGISEAVPGAPGVPKLTLRSETLRTPDGLVALSAVAYLERPGQEGVLRGRIVSALHEGAPVALELRQAILDVTASLIGRNRPEGSTVKRVMLGEAAAAPSPFAEVPFPALRVRVHPLDPPYPRAARLLRVQGHVKVRLTLGTGGRPLRADLVSGPDELVLTGLCSAMRWAFDPVQGPGGPVEARTVMDIPFTLSKGLVDPALPVEEIPRTGSPSMSRHGVD